MTSDPTTLKEVWTIFDGLPLLYRTNATPLAGARTIIHIHGFAISGRYLLPTASRLAADYRTFIPDLPGFGRSHHPPRPLTIDELGDAVVQFMDQQGIERAVLLGNSLGCPIIAAMLDEHTDRIEAAIWVSPAGGRYNLPIFRGVAQMALAGLREPPRMVPIAMADYARFGLMPSMRLLWSMLHYPTVQRLQELVIPTLVVIGSRDPLVSEAVSLSGRSSCPTSQRRSSTGRPTPSTSRTRSSSRTSSAASSRVDRSPQTCPRGEAFASSRPRSSREPVTEVPGGAGRTDAQGDLPVVSEDLGEGPPLILLHGLGGSARWWSRNLSALARSRRVIAVDLPGFGASPRGQRLDLAEVVDQLAEAMDRLAIDRASVIGHSMGGLIAGGLAADHPDRVDQLILVDAAFLSLARFAVRPLSGPIVTLRWTAPSLLPVLVADGLRSGPRRLTDAAVQLVRADWRTRLPRIESPTLVIWGEHDRICPATIGRRIADLVPNARLVVIEGAAHNPMWERPDAFNQEVLEFLSSS